MSPKKVFTVVGALGNQGSGVLSFLINNPDYQARAITRRPDSPAAQELAAKGVEVVSADADDVESLRAAFAGSHTIFAVTNFFEAFLGSGAEAGVEIEAQQGINLARAAAATPTLEHYIWSTLPNVKAISGGTHSVPHFDGKNLADAFIRANDDLLKKTTFLWVGWFHTNYTIPIFAPYHIPTANKYVQLAHSSPDTPITTIGDVRANLGPFIEAIVANPAQTANGRIVIAALATLTAGELLQAWGRATGNEVTFVRTDAETYHSLWPVLAEKIGAMMLFWDEYREKSWLDAAGVILTREDLGIDASRLLGLEESFRGMKL